MFPTKLRKFTSVLSVSSSAVAVKNDIHSSFSSETIKKRSGKITYKPIKTNVELISEAGSSLFHPAGANSL